MRILYSMFFGLYLCLVLPFYAARGKLKKGWRGRLGIFPPNEAAKLEGKDVLWIHAVSVGEARLACQLAGKLKARLPRLNVLLTTVTPSGQEIARQLLAPEDADWKDRPVCPIVL